MLKAIYKDHTIEEINFICNQLLQIIDNFSESLVMKFIMKKMGNHFLFNNICDGIYNQDEPTLVTLNDFRKAFWKSCKSCTYSSFLNQLVMVVLQFQVINI